MALLTTILLAAHLLAMNVATASPLVCVWLQWRGRQGDATAREVGRRLAGISVAALLLGVAFGAALWGAAWLAGDAAYFAALNRFPMRALVHAGGEILFSLVCLTVYAATWNRWSDRPWLHGLWAAVASTNLLYHFPPLMIVLGELSMRPQFVAETSITREAFRPLLLRPEIVSQVLHFALASATIAGLALMLVAADPRRLASAGGMYDEDLHSVQDARHLIRIGAWTALIASLAQFVIGPWVLIEMPVDARNGLMGDQWLATALFLVAIVVAFAAIHALAAVAFGEVTPKNIRRGVVLVLGVVVLMAGVLQSVRHGSRIASRTQPLTDKEAARANINMYHSVVRSGS